MCLFPVRFLVQGRYMAFDCGRCSECVEKIQSQCVATAILQHKESTYTAFVTLTMDEEHLTHVDSSETFKYKINKTETKEVSVDYIVDTLSSQINSDYERNVYNKFLDVVSLPIVDRMKVRNFIKRFSMKIMRKYGECLNPSAKPACRRYKKGTYPEYKWMWFPEYGTKNTQRPHFHGLAFVSLPAGFTGCYGFNNVVDDIRGSWRQGLMYDVRGLPVDCVVKRVSGSSQAVSYASKYVSKCCESGIKYRPNSDILRAISAFFTKYVNWYQHSNGMCSKSMEAYSKYYQQSPFAPRVVRDGKYCYSMPSFMSAQLFKMTKVYDDKGYERYYRLPLVYNKDYMFNLETIKDTCSQQQFDELRSEIVSFLLENFVSIPPNLDDYIRMFYNGSFVSPLPYISRKGSYFSDVGGFPHYIDCDDWFYCSWLDHYHEYDKYARVFSCFDAAKLRRRRLLNENRESYNKYKISRKYIFSL